MSKCSGMSGACLHGVGKVCSICGVAGKAGYRRWSHESHRCNADGRPLLLKMLNDTCLCHSLRLSRDQEKLRRLYRRCSRCPHAAVNHRNRHSRAEMAGRSKIPANSDHPAVSADGEDRLPTYPPVGPPGWHQIAPLHTPIAPRCAMLSWWVVSGTWFELQSDYQSRPYPWNDSCLP